MVDIDNTFINMSEGVEGDFMEFGVQSGDSFNSIINFMNEHELFKNRRLFGFDSWEGLPEEEYGVEIYGSWFKGNFKANYEDVKICIDLFKTKNNISDDRIVLVKGWFKDTLNEKFIKDNNISKLAFANIDVDLYISCKEVLEFIIPLIHKGTIIRFDDWTNSNQGEFKAWNEFILKYPFLYEKRDNGYEQIITIL